MAVDDHGLEVLKKAGEQVTPGSPANYYIKVGVLGTVTVAGAAPPSPSGIALARHDYTVPVTTGAYTQLIASTTATISQIFIFDSSGQTLVLALGAAASEVDKLYIIPGGNGLVPINIPSGSRVSIRAISGNATVGEISVSFLG